MDKIEKDLAPFIEERLQNSFRDLKNSKKYKALNLHYNTLYKELSEKLNTDVELYENISNILFEMQSLELHRSYLLGFVDGIRLFEHLKKN
ncbi:MAG: hypothetical protein KH434_02460 [Clostridium sp.]|mgnify:CR=1 FL=1|nr:hypothetical protein [Clostridium sp.]